MKNYWKNGLEWSKKFATKFKEKIKENKKFSIYILFLIIFFSYIFVTKINFFEEKSQKNYETNVVKMNANSDKLRILKLNQMAQMLGIKPLHAEDINIINYSQTVFSSDVRMQNITTNQVFNFPKNKTLMVVHYANGSKIYHFQSLIMKKIEE